MNEDRRSRAGWPPPIEPVRSTLGPPRWLVRVVIALCVAVLAMALALSLAIAWTLDLKHARDTQGSEQQARIDATFCKVLAELPQASAELELIRHDLRCTQPGLSPEQTHQLETGGTP